MCKGRQPLVAGVRPLASENIALFLQSDAGLGIQGKGFEIFCLH